jgi:hypothetical protein
MNGKYEVEITIDTEELSEYFMEKLIQKGYVPDEDILDALANITFDFLIDKGIINEEEIEEESE